MRQITLNGTYITIRIHKHNKRTYNIKIKIHNLQNETEAYKTYDDI